MHIHPNYCALPSESDNGDVAAASGESWSVFHRQQLQCLCTRQGITNREHDPPRCRSPHGRLNSTTGNVQRPIPQRALHACGRFVCCQVHWLRVGDTANHKHGAHVVQTFRSRKASCRHDVKSRCTSKGAAAIPVCNSVWVPGPVHSPWELRDSSRVVISHMSPILRPLYTPRPNVKYNDRPHSFYYGENSNSRMPNLNRTSPHRTYI